MLTTQMDIKIKHLEEEETHWTSPNITLVIVFYITLKNKYKINLGNKVYVIISNQLILSLVCDD